MNILIVGYEHIFTELKLKLGDLHTYELYAHVDISADLSVYDVIIDSIIHESPEHYDIYRKWEGKLVLLNTVMITLAELRFTFGTSDAHIFGINGLPTFINREVLEVSACQGSHSFDLLDDLFPSYQVVEDRVGLVTPRIVLMIINEAYYTVQEGTASKEAIDQAMKLGTNYPYGPFEWAKKIGIANVFETLEVLYDDTKEERYKIAPLLKREYLAGN